MNQTPYGFTGEPMDANGLLYLRARYYSPNLGVFTALDPFEGMADRPMSINGYSWVEGNAANLVDPSGKSGVLAAVRSAIGSRQIALALSSGVCQSISDDCYCYDDDIVGVNAYLCRLGEIPTCTDRYADQYDLPSVRCRRIRERARELRTTVDAKGTLKQGLSYTDVDALVNLLDFASYLPGVTSSQQVADDISCALLNVRGSSTIFAALSVIVRGEKDKTAWDWFRDTGFHSDYQDRGNQINHFWSFLNTVAQGNLGLHAAQLGHAIHEQCGIPEAFSPENGASIQDERLTYLGFALGVAINEGLIPPSQLGRIVGNYLRSPFPDEDPSNPSSWCFNALCKLLQPLTGNRCLTDASQWRDE